MLIVEDVITTGKSSLECVKLISKSEAKLLGFACIIDRSTKKNLKIKQDKKKVVVFSNFPVFFPLHEEVYGWTKIQLTDYKKIIFDKKTTKLSDIELTSLRKKYYLKLNHDHRLVFLYLTILRSILWSHLP